MKIIGIDPGCTTSPTAIAMIEVQGSVASIKGIYEVHPLVGALSFTDRVRLISTSIKIIADGFEPDLIFLEFSHYMGKANISFLKLLGAIEFQLKQEVKYVYPTQIKKFFGAGTLQKEAVAEELKKHFKKAEKTIQALIDTKKFDSTDSLAIALGGYCLWNTKSGFVQGTPLEKEVICQNQ